MPAAIPGTPVTSATPNTTTNKSITAALASTTPGDTNLLVLSGLASGTGVNPTMTLPGGWTLLFEQMSNSGTPSTFVGVYWRRVQAGDGSSQVFNWANAGQMVADCMPFSNADPVNPFPYFNAIPHASGAGSTYAISGTTGADQGLLLYGGANKTGTAWSNLTDNDAGQKGLTSSATMCQRITAAELPAGTAYSKSMTGSASTIGVQWAIVVKGAASSTASAAFTGDGSLAAAQVEADVSAVAAFSGAGSLSASGVAGGGGVAAFTGSGSLGATAGPVAAAAGATLTGNGVLQSIGRTAAAQQLLTGGPQFVAHRNGVWATYGECTLAGYRASAAQYSKALMEIPVWASSDGVYYCLHDRTTGSRNQYTGPNGNVDVTATSSAVLDQYTSVVGGYPLARLTDVIDALPGRVFVVENKQGVNQAGLCTIMDAHASGRWIFKGPYNDTANALIAASHSNAPMWLYFYPSQLGSLQTTLNAVAAAGVLVIFGIGDYSSAPVPVQSDADTFYAFVKANGLMAWAHILGTTAQRTTADSQAAADSYTLNGYMVSNFPAIAPNDSAVASFGGAGTLAAVSAAPATSAAVAFIGGGQLQATEAQMSAAAAVVLAGTGALAVVSTAPSSSSAATLGGDGALEVAGAAVLGVQVAFAGSGSLLADAHAAAAAVADLTGDGQLATATLAALTASAALDGTGQLLVAAGSGTDAAVPLGGSGALVVATSPDLTAGALLAGAGVLDASGQSWLFVTAALTGDGVLLAIGRANLGGQRLDGNLRWRLGPSRWDWLGRPARWRVRIGGPRWSWQAEGIGVKSTDRRLVSLQVQSPLPLNAEGVTVTCCVSPDRTVPAEPDEQPVQIPADYDWPGPTGWATVGALVGPGLPVGTVYVLTHVQAGDEDFWDVAAAVQVEE